jgi:ATP-dependent RNA helicase DDX3X
MADGLQMGNLSLQDSQHAPQGGPPGRAAYIPPHLRGRNVGASMDGPAAAAAAPPPGPGAGFSGARYDI